MISHNSRGGKAPLARPKIMVITSTKWEENMTRKYLVASSAIVPKMGGTLVPDGTIWPHRVVESSINENARESEELIGGEVRTISPRFEIPAHAPYNKEMLVYAISRVLCGAKTHTRNASMGICGSG